MAHDLVQRLHRCRTRRPGPRAHCESASMHLVRMRSCAAAPFLLPFIIASSAAAEFQQSSLAPAGPQAAYIGDLWSLTLAVSTLVWIAIMLAIVVAVTRTPHAHAAEGLAP